MSGRATTVLAVIIMGVLIGALVLFARWRREVRLESGEGELRSSLLVEGDGPVLLSIESLEFSSEDSDETIYRLSTWDAVTGKRLARVKEVPWRDCAAASRGLVWCVTDQREVEVLNVPSLTVKHAKVSATLGGKIMNASNLEVSSLGKLRATLADGKKVEVDAETLSTAPQVTEPPRDSPPSPRVSDCSIPNSERRGLCERDESGQLQRVDATDGWLRLQVVSELPDGWILCVNTSLDDAANQRRVVKLDQAFKEVGSTTIGQLPGWSTIKPLWVKPNELFLVSSTEVDATIGIDAKSGHELFRIAH